MTGYTEFMWQVVIGLESFNGEFLSLKKHDLLPGSYDLKIIYFVYVLSPLAFGKLTFSHPCRCAFYLVLFSAKNGKKAS